MTLEWLLIIAAIAGLAAVSALAVQWAIDDSTDLPPRPDVRVVDAEIEAAQVAHEANESIEANPGSYVDSTFQTRCAAVATKYSDVVSAFAWTTPVYDSVNSTFTTRAKCVLTRL